MTSGVKMIFSTLVKVTAYIIASFLVFNLVAFTISYFRVVGASYSLQQVVMDNNYLTEQDLQSFNTYLSKLDTAYLTNLHVVINTDPSGTQTDRDTFINEREQYGNVVEVGIAADYNFIMPLMRNQMTQDDGGVNGLNTGRNAVWLSSAELKQKRENNRAHANIDVINPVVGLQYYSDLR